VIVELIAQGLFVALGEIASARGERPDPIGQCGVVAVGV
jgi:hypothetical protein